ncbi:lipoyl synthase [Buchnera aphidicola]|uniref:lipoyl synthase n=1 Tax=Buchnera aphidicola TaxID=9 RepID=UPI003464BEAD
MNIKNLNFFTKENVLKKPNWIKVKLLNNNNNVKYVTSMIKKNSLHSVCEEAQCPNLSECFSRKTVTFMILGSICTRKCPFCAVRSGRPNSVDLNEPKNLSSAILKIGLKYVVLTSVARDDLRDGGAEHFSKCIFFIRKNKDIKIEILVPDFRKCRNNALSILGNSLPDVFNHNIENVPRLYKKIRPGANYISSLKLLSEFKNLYPTIPTKSGLMLGLGEKECEIIEVMKDLYDSGVTMITLGQYLQPSKFHLPVKKYLTLSEFKNIEKEAKSIGFSNVFCGPFVRSSYHAEEQNIKNEFIL